MMRILILASGDGSLAQAIIDAVGDGRLRAQVVAILSDNPKANVLARAKRAGITTTVIPMKSDRQRWDAEISAAVAEFHPDLVVSAGFMRILSADFVKRFKTINTHPALLPLFPGTHAVRDALVAKASITGATVHWVDAGLDSGKVISQVSIDVLPQDSEDSLHERIKIVERSLIVSTLIDLLPTLEKKMPERKAIRRALVSVYDKTGLVELGELLQAHGVEILSTGSTAKTLQSAGIKVTEVGDYTGFPEMMGGRVKTLHPRIHAGILADQSNPSHIEQIAQHDIAAFDLVVVNLYPFMQTIASGATFEESIEQIDIGGPSMLRGAAKNHGSVAVLCQVSQYDLLKSSMSLGGLTAKERQDLALEVFRTTAEYDLSIARWLGGQSGLGQSDFPEWFGQIWQRKSGLRYGENPHQEAAVYANAGVPTGIVGAVQLHGKEMSFNNYTDADAAWRAAHDHAEPCVAIIKHANPCGIAISHNISSAHKKAHECDPVSAFGGVVAANREVDLVMAQALSEIFTEVIVAPSFSPQALELLMKKSAIRLLTCQTSTSSPLELRPVSGGMLVQQTDLIDATGDDPKTWVQVAGDPLSHEAMEDLSFAWRSVRAVKSNAILLAKSGASVGVGMGQVNRVDSSRLAVTRAGDRAKGSVAASDAFFPFADGLQILIDAGVSAVVQPGGSKRDDEVIAAAKEAGIAMFFTGTRHFSHA